MNAQQLTQGRQDGQASERANGTSSTGATSMAPLRQMGRVGKLTAGIVVAALVAVIGIMVAPTQDEAQARAGATMVRLDYVAGVGLYDNGWAGGPARGATMKAPTLARVPYEAGWTLYDNGYAGGPALKADTSPATTLKARPATTGLLYHHGWDIYDDGWAGGPKTGR